MQHWYTILKNITTICLTNGLASTINERYALITGQSGLNGSCKRTNAITAWWRILDLGS